MENFTGWYFQTMAEKFYRNKTCIEQLNISFVSLGWKINFTLRSSRLITRILSSFNLIALKKNLIPHVMVVAVPCWLQIILGPLWHNVALNVTYLRTESKLCYMRTSSCNFSLQPRWCDNVATSSVKNIDRDGMENV